MVRELGSHGRRVAAAVGLCLVVSMGWLAASAAATTIEVNSLQQTAVFDQAGAGDFTVIVRKTVSTPTTGYEITVTNRGTHAARNLWVCDRIPPHMAFVRASRALRAFHGMRCLVIARFLPHHSTSLHLTVRVARPRHRASPVRGPAPVFTG